MIRFNSSLYLHLLQKNQYVSGLSVIFICPMVYYSDLLFLFFLSSVPKFIYPFKV